MGPKSVVSTAVASAVIKMSTIFPPMRIAESVPLKSRSRSCAFTAPGRPSSTKRFTLILLMPEYAISAAEKKAESTKQKRKRARKPKNDI